MEAADLELIAEFAIESLEGLANIEQQMLSIESRGADIDVDLVNAVFRTMHSIKGTAGFLGLERIGQLAHSLEEVLNRMRNRDIVPSSELVTTVLQAADFMKDLIESAETSNAADVEGHVAALQQHRPDAPSSKTPATVPNVATVVATPPATASNAPSEAVREFLIECCENLEQMDHDLLALEQNASSTPLLRGIFRTMHTIKGGAGFLGLGKLEGLAHAAENLLGKLRDGTLAINPAIITALLATVNGCRDGLGLLESHGNDAGFQPEVLIAQLGQAECATSVSSALPEQATVAKPEAVKLSETLPTPAPEQVEKSSGPAGDASNADKNNSAAGESTIRVDVALLDKLMTRVGELVLARNQILQFTTGLEDAAFVSTAQRLNLITAELQESVMKTRMQPIGNVWAKFPRVVRDLSSQLGKQVNIEMEGKETELDKTIVEAIKDPLTHLVRNSVDHGIESPGRDVLPESPVKARFCCVLITKGGRSTLRSPTTAPGSISSAFVARPSSADFSPPTKRRGCRIVMRPS